MPCSWGYPFLYESYLYHLHRLDHRHNFSPYFYLTYLTYPSLSGAASASSASAPFLPFGTWTRLMRSPLTSFVPQMGLALGLGFLFGRRKEDLVFTWFVQTVVFVVFNKVCTSQVRVSILHIQQRSCDTNYRHSLLYSTSSGICSSCRSSCRNCACRARRRVRASLCGWARRRCGSRTHIGSSSLARMCTLAYGCGGLFMWWAIAGCWRGLWTRMAKEK